MSRQCELSGVRPKVGNNVSHSHVKTKRRFEPNLVQASLHSDMLGRTVRMRIAARELRTVDKLGGLDAYLQKARSEQLSPRLQKVKREIETRLSEAAS
jgi:large subunit ribosomal protein L28